jgi:predicted ATPase
MSDGSRFPVNLLTQSKADRLAYFKSYTIAHPALKKLDARLKRIIEEPGDAGLIFVYGPTGVGKSTLMDRVAARLEVEDAPGSGRATLPVLELEASAPEQGNFHWGQFYRQALIELETPFHRAACDEEGGRSGGAEAGTEASGRSAEAEAERCALDKQMYSSARENAVRYGARK